MAEQSGGQSNELRASARRVLRARRRREPRKRPARWGLLVALIAVPLSAAAALALRPAHTPAELAQQPVAQAASVAARELRGFAPEPAPGPSENTPVSQAAPDPAQAPELQTVGNWLRVRAGPGASAVHVIYATAGGRFDIRAGDMIVDLCDRPGAESAAEMSAALANDVAACLVISRGGELVHATRRRVPGDVEGPAL